MAKKNTPKIRQKASGRTAVRPTRKNDKKSMILKGFSKKKLIWRKNRKKCDFKGLFGQKMQNSMSRFCTLLALHFYWHFGCFKNEFLLGKYRTHGPLYSNDSRVLDLRFFFLPSVWSYLLGILATVYVLVHILQLARSCNCHRDHRCARIKPTPPLTIYLGSLKLR